MRCDLAGPVLPPSTPFLAYVRSALILPEGREAKNRLHFRVPDRGALADRVVGGRELGEHEEGDLPAWTILADPEGSKFCVYGPKRPN